MGVCLGYRSTLPVTEATAATMIAEAESFAASREWWAEPVRFFPPDFSEVAPKGWFAPILNWIDSGLGISGTFIRGDTKISLAGGYSGPGGSYVEVDPLENELMGYVDCVAIVEFLKRLSRKHKVGWALENVGEPCGTISPEGMPDSQLFGFLQGFTDEFEPLDPNLPERVRQISQKYASRDS